MAPAFNSQDFTSSRNRNLYVKKTALRHLGDLPSAQKCYSVTNHLGEDIENVCNIHLTLFIWRVAYVLRDLYFPLKGSLHVLPTKLEQ
jgi:hypothetical protein